MYSNSTVIADGVAEASLTSQADQEILGDPLTTTIFDAMPEVMANIAMMNATNATLWGNIDGYVQGMVMLSYQVTWNAMVETFYTHIREEATAYPPRYLISIKVQRGALVGWAIVVLAVIIPGLVFLLIEIHITLNDDAPVLVEDSTIAALRLDVSDICQDIPSLCKSTKLSGTDKMAGLRFRKVPEEQSHTYQQAIWCRFRRLEKVLPAKKDEVLDINEGHEEYRGYMRCEGREGYEE
ncbi:unnamed protein product [Parascedosporium putredinis]|uniref:Uncharacterized protein n=1 Tax=Parascedosporium putredinis TaxID=1442378 RepID=A0A9P1MEG5_9PEZI|nr:unnamed protein product [Parascedosporium putredinis]CAI8000506.1 unnamed protein product [Parascedosporium putredinis]